MAPPEVLVEPQECRWRAARDRTITEGPPFCPLSRPTPLDFSVESKKCTHLNSVSIDLWFVKKPDRCTYISSYSFAVLQLLFTSPTSADICSNTTPRHKQGLNLNQLVSIKRLTGCGLGSGVEVGFPCWPRCGCPSGASPAGRTCPHKEDIALVSVSVFKMKEVEEKCLFRSQETLAK